MSKKKTKAAPEADSQLALQTVSIDSFEKRPPKDRTTRYTKVADALYDAPKGKGIVIEVPKGRKVDQLRNYLYQSMKKRMVEKGIEDPKVAIAVAKDEKSLLLTLQ